MMKKLSLVLLLMVFTFPALVSGFDFEKIGAKREIASGTISSTGWVTCHTLNVRVHPWKAIVGRLHRRDAVTIVGESRDKQWYAIQYKGAKRFVFKQYISTTQVPQAPVDTTSIPPEDTVTIFPFQGIVIANNLPVRHSPWGAVIGRLSKDSTVTVVEQQGNWYRIKHNSGYAWVNSNYVEQSTTPPAPPVTTTAPATPATPAPPAQGPVDNSFKGLPYPDSVKEYLNTTSKSRQDHPQVMEIAKSCIADTPLQTAKNIFKWMRRNVSYEYYYNSSSLGALKGLNTGKANCCDQASLIVSLLRACGIPARWVTCKSCTFSSGKSVGHVWAQAYIDGVWQPLDTTSSRNSVGTIKSFTKNTSEKTKLNL